MHWMMVVFLYRSILHRLQGMDVAAFERANGPSMDDPLRSHMEYARSVLKLRPGERAVVCNGRVRKASR